MNKNMILKAITTMLLIVFPFVFSFIEPVRAFLALVLLYSFPILVIIIFIVAVWITVDILFDKDLSCHLGVGLLMVFFTLILGILLIQLLSLIYFNQPIF
jgi:hypothetical protein